MSRIVIVILIYHRHKPISYLHIITLFYSYTDTELNRSLLEKLPVTQPLNKFPTFYIHKCPPLVPIISQKNLLHPISLAVSVNLPDRHSFLSIRQCHVHCLSCRSSQNPRPRPRLYVTFCNRLYFYDEELLDSRPGA
jgi:hypothetical protein